MVMTNRETQIGPISDFKLCRKKKHCGNDQKNRNVAQNAGHLRLLLSVVASNPAPKTIFEALACNIIRTPKTKKNQKSSGNLLDQSSE
jgi:hypothetical protein